MTVVLWHAPISDHFPAGHKSMFETEEEATDQAISDVQTNRDPQPIRIEAQDGQVLVDRAQMVKLAG